MLPPQLFEIICCPFCRGDLAGTEELKCTSCQKTFPVVDGIPVLLVQSDDEVSRTISSFYSQAWKRDNDGELKAKRIHEDTSIYGQNHINGREQRFDAEFQRSDSPRFFLDAACGGQPRVQLGQAFQYHVCIDFSLDGLMESRRILGDRAICICGSLLQLPVKDDVFAGVLASHCIYHIDKDLQETALSELTRVLAPNGKLVVFYANPARKNLVASAIHTMRRANRTAKRLLRRTKQPSAAEMQGRIYVHLHPISWMRRVLTKRHPLDVEVRPLCALMREETEAFFKRPVLGPVAYRAVQALDRRWDSRPEQCYYIGYIAKRGSDNGG